MPQAKKNLTGKLLKELWKIGARHALYREDGKWYHQLSDFPGALFDANGYRVFETEREYHECPYLQIQQDLHVPSGISAIPGYIRVTERSQFQAFSQRLKETAGQSQNDSVQPQLGESCQSLETPKANDLPEEQDEVKRALAQVHRIIRDTEIARRVKFIHKYRCQICGETIDLGDRGLYAEAHNIRPLGGKHKGPDVIENIICVCPNHHVLLDYGAIMIDKATLRLTEAHRISNAYIHYHNTAIYKHGVG